MQEIWKDIEGYEGLYRISNLGRVYSYPRYHTKGGYTFGKKCNGYLEFFLCRSKDDHIRRYMHILVWEVFNGPIPKGYVVHHKDHNRHNNCIDNLELLTDSEHKKRHSTEDYESKKEKMLRHSVKSHLRPIVQYTLEGEFVAEYTSIKEAASKNKINQSNISKACIGINKTAGGFIWKYKDNNNNLNAA